MVMVPRKDVKIYLTIATIISVAVIFYWNSTFSKNPQFQEIHKHLNKSNAQVDEVTVHKSPSRSTQLEFVQQREVNNLDTYLLNKSHCRIPLVHTVSSAFEYANIGKLMIDQCDQSPDFTQLENDILKLTDDDLRVEDCCVREISRRLIDPTDSFKRGDCLMLDKETRLLNVSQMDSLEIECHMGTTTRYNFHINVPLKGPIRRKFEYWRLLEKAGQERPPSILMLVLDSTSRTDFYRNLPRVTHFLLHEMGFVDFKGHHPLGEATLVNVLPLLVGLSTNEFWSTYKHNLPSTFWDSTPFIWETFDDMNYITGYLEDDPSVGTFNYGTQSGFVHRPTDFYSRPLMLAAYPHITRQSKDNSRCFGHRGVVEFLLDHLLDIVTRLPNTPSFLVTWPCWPQHDFPFSLYAQEDTLLKFFSSLSQITNILDNTLIVVTGDHGYYRGQYHTTFHEGLLERRSLPLLIRLPDNLSRQHSQFLGSLIHNSESITTHFDVYQTLVHIAKLSDPFQQVDAMDTHGQSLLVKLADGRSCSDATIPETMCACNRQVPLNNRNFLNETIEPSLYIDRSQFPIPSI